MGSMLTGEKPHVGADRRIQPLWHKEIKAQSAEFLESLKRTHAVISQYQPIVDGIPIPMPRYVVGCACGWVTGAATKIKAFQEQHGHYAAPCPAGKFRHVSVVGGRNGLPFANLSRTKKQD